MDCAHKHRVSQNRFAQKRQRRTRNSKCLANQRRFNIQHPVVKPRFGACLPGMDFIGMQDDHLPRQAVRPRPTIIEPLHASDRIPDGIGVMAMGRIRVAGEIGFNPLNTCLPWRSADPILRARSFKTGRHIM